MFPGGARYDVDQHGRLSVQGGPGNDAIGVRRLGNGNYELSVNGDRRQIPGKGISSVDIRAGEGNDKVVVDRSVRVPVSIDGGNGHDQIRNGADRASIAGGNGDDFIANTGRGAFISGGRGRDTIANLPDPSARALDELYRPTGPTVIDGGAGDDTIVNAQKGAIMRGGKGDDTVVNTADRAIIERDRGDRVFNTGRDTIVHGGKPRIGIGPIPGLQPDPVMRPLPAPLQTEPQREQRNPLGGLDPRVLAGTGGIGLPDVRVGAGGVDVRAGEVGVQAGRNGVGVRVGDDVRVDVGAGGVGVRAGEVGVQAGRDGVGVRVGGVGVDIGTGGLRVRF